MAKIIKFLTEWEKSGLIDSLQMQKIIDYENRKDKKPWILYGFIMLGVSILSIGIVSLIAANWSDIPSVVKISADIILLISAALAIYRVSDKNNQVMFDALSAFFVFFYLASIGLLSQVYHTGGELYEALILLSVVMLPITLLSYRKFLPNVWAFILLLAVVLFCANLIDNYDRDDSYFFAVGVLISLPLISAVCGNFLSLKNSVNKISPPFIFWSIILYFAGVFFFDFSNSINSYSYYNSTFSYYSDDISLTPFILIVSFTALLALVSILINIRLPRKIKLLSSILVIVYAVCMNSLVYFDRYFYMLYKAKNYNHDLKLVYYSILKAAGPAETIFTLLIFSFIFLSLNMEKLFNLMIMLIGVRFLIIYFQVFGSLAYTGIGLIISGLIIIGFVAAWYRYGKKIGGLIK